MRNHSPFYCLIPGSFRPPHQGHYEMISHYQSLASEVGGKVIVIVSNPSKKNERLTGSGQVISAEFSKNKLSEMFNGKLDVRISEQSPVKDCYEFGNDISEGTVMFGCSTKDKDVQRFNSIKNYYNKKFPNINVLVEPFEIKTLVSASEIRKQM